MTPYLDADFLLTLLVNTDETHRANMLLRRMAGPFTAQCAPSIAGREPDHAASSVSVTRRPRRRRASVSALASLSRGKRVRTYECRLAGGLRIGDQMEPQSTAPAAALIALPPRP